MGEAFHNLQAMFDNEAELLDVNPGQRVVVVCEDISNSMMGGARLDGCTFSP